MEHARWLRSGGATCGRTTLGARGIAPKWGRNVRLRDPWSMLDSSEVGAHSEVHDSWSMRESAKLRAQFGGARPFKRPRKLQTASSYYLYVPRRACEGAQAPIVRTKSGELEKGRSAPLGRLRKLERIFAQIPNCRGARTPMLRKTRTLSTLYAHLPKNASRQRRATAITLLWRGKIDVRFAAEMHFEGAQPSEHAGKSQGGGEFRGFATVGACGAASE